MATYNYSVDPTTGSYQFSPASDGIRYFVDNHKADILAAISGTGIYFPVIVAQCCWESAFGTTDKARTYNNFIGIHYSPTLPGTKGIIPSGSHLLAWFTSPLDCFHIYTGILTDPTKKYMSKGLLTATTPQAQLKAVAAGGYSTTPTYYTDVVRLVNLCLGLYSVGKIS